MFGSGQPGLMRYIAAFDTPHEIPDFEEFEIPEFSYMVTHAASLAEGHIAWDTADKPLQSNPEFELYHGPNGWSESVYPTLEVYSPGDPNDRGYDILMPVRQRQE
jgi:predicted transcriptional regulator YdeE